MEDEPHGILSETARLPYTLIYRLVRCGVEMAPNVAEPNISAALLIEMGLMVTRKQCLKAQRKLAS